MQESKFTSKNIKNCGKYFFLVQNKVSYYAIRISSIKQMKKIMH